VPYCDPREIAILAKVGSMAQPVEIPSEFLTASSATEKGSAKRPAMAFEGHVDRLTRWGAVGWAWLPHSPDEAVLVEAIHEGVVIGRTAANRMREDLAAHGKGTGKYGFELSFDQPVKDDVRPEFRILAPTDGYLHNDQTLPKWIANERSIPGRGDID